MKKLDVDDALHAMNALYKRIDQKIAKYGELTQDEIEKEIERYRVEKRRRRA